MKKKPVARSGKGIESKTSAKRAPVKHRTGLDLKQLRRQAEQDLRKNRGKIQAMSSEEVQQLVHELQMNQVELELQHENLRQTQLELEVTKDRYAMVYDFAPVGFLTLDIKGRILEINLTACQLLGRSRTRLMRKIFESFLSPPDQIRLRQHLDLTLKSRSKQVSDIFRFPHDHTPYLIRLESIPDIPSGTVPIPGVRMAMIDMTAQMKIEQERMEQERWFRGVLQTAMDAIISIHEDQKIVLFNMAAEQMFGCPSSDAIGTDIHRFIPRRFRNAHRGHIQRFARSQDSSRTMRSLGTLFGLRADGTEFPIEASISRYQGEGKKNVLTVILRDITKRFEAEGQLRDSQRTLATLMRNLPGMAYRCRNDRHWTMEFVSEGVKNLTGYEPPDLLGNHRISFGRDLILPEDRRSVRKTVQSALRKKEPYLCTYRIKTADGTLKWVWEQGQGIFSPKGRLETLEGFITDITEHVRDKEALKASEERLNFAMVGARLGAWDWNIQAGEVLMTPQWAKMLGYRPDEIGTTIDAWKELMHPEDKPRVLKLLQAHLDGHTPYYQTEHRLRTKAGKWKWVLDTGKIVERDSRGRPLRASGIHKDIQQRKEIEHELSREREFISAVLDTAGALVIVLNRQGRIVRFNRSCEQLTGLSSRDVLGKSLWKANLIPSREVKPVKQVFRDLCEGQENRHGENHWIAKNRTERLISWANTILKNSNGRVEYVIGTGLDLTDRNRMETALRQNQRRFEAFMDHTPTVAFLKDREGAYVYVNKTFERQFRRCQSECKGKTDSQLFPPEISQMFTLSDHRVLSGLRTVESEETTIDDEGKKRHWLVLKFPISGENKETFVGGIALDITLRKKAEQALQEREQDLRLSQEALQALGKRLVTAQEEERRRISRELHDDMNQRLAVLALTIQGTQHSVGESDPLYQVLQQLYDDVSSISDDIRRLAYQLHPSILDDLGLPIALQSFVQDFSQWSKISADFRAKDVPTSISPDIAACVYRITQESLRNVARHAHASRVTVDLEGETTGLRLSIIDNGKGFDPESVRADRRGLGLVSMQERVSYVNGNLTINGMPGNGTKIDVWVPLPKEDA